MSDGAAALFPILLQAIDRDPTEKPPLTLVLGKTTEKEVASLVEAPFPSKARGVDRQDDWSLRYRFIQGNYDHFAITYKFGSRDDAWKGKLFSAHFSLNRPGLRVGTEDTLLYRALLEDFGPPTRVEPFHMDKDREIEGLQLYVWERPEVVFTYRSGYNASDRLTFMVVCVWDANFYRSHGYWDF